MEQIWSHIFIEDYKSGFHKVSEKTLSSPSGRPLGHYRAGLTSDSICFVYSTLKTLPFEFGFIALVRWTNALPVMLEKAAGTPRLDKFRVIQLLEADLWFYICK